MRMRRRCEKEGLAAKCPNVAKLFEGSDQDRLSLLRTWLASGEVLDKCELSLEMTKEVENMYEGEDQLLTIEGMRKAGFQRH